MLRNLFVVILCLSWGSTLAQDSNRKMYKKSIKDWETTFYYSYFSKYYYGYYSSYGAAELGLGFGAKGWEIDVTGWIRDQLGASVGFNSGYKGEFGLSLMGAYAHTPQLYATLGPQIRFVPQTSEAPSSTKIGIDVGVVYYYFKDIGFKVNYSSTSSIMVGANVRISNIIFER